MSHAIVVARAFACVVTASVALSAGAAGQRSFVASNGSDAGTCTLAQPCRSFATAVANTNADGEVIVLDSAGYGAVIITKSITIASPAGVYAGISVFAGDGVTVNGANIVVVLRGLSINWQGGINGIWFVQGRELVVQDCEIGGLFTNAILASAPGGHMSVARTTMRRAGTGFHAVGALTATLDNVRVHGNSDGVNAGNNSRVIVTNSTLSNNTTGAFAGASNSALTDLTVARSTISGTSTVALAVSAGPGATARIVSDGNTIDGANTAFQFYASGGTMFIYTAGNNSVDFVNTVTAGGTLTQCCAI